MQTAAMTVEITTSKASSGAPFTNVCYRINGVNYPITGPSAAFQGSRYLYIEASGRPAGQVARYVNIRAGQPVKSPGT